MKKKNNNLGFFIWTIAFSMMVLYIQNTVGNNLFPIYIAEIIIGIILSKTLFKPLSKLINKDNPENTYWAIFGIRNLFVIVCVLMIQMNIIGLEILLIIVSAIYMPIFTKFMNKPDTNTTSTDATTSGENISYLCKTCNVLIPGDNNFCPNCGNALDKSNNYEEQVIYKKAVLPSEFDPVYLLSEEKLLEEFIKRELPKARIDPNTKYLPASAYQKKQVLNIIFAVLVFIYVCLIFFHFPVLTYLIGFIILLIFRKYTDKFDFMKFLEKEIKARPQEKILNIIMNVKQTMVEDTSKKMLMISVVVAVILPLIIFFKPHILYEKMDNGYGVRFYTFGLTNFTSATIPETYNGKSVVSLRGNTFSNMFLLNKVTLPDSITEIRGQAFKNDYFLTTVNIPASLEYLGGGAFYNCKSITQIELPDTLTFLGGESFYGASSLKNIKLSVQLNEIRGNSFENCSSLESITIPDEVTRIGGHAFYGCSKLSKVDISESSKLKEIGSSSFRMCDSLYDVTLPYGVYVNERAFKESPTRIHYYSNNNIDDNYNYWGDYEY